MRTNRMQIAGFMLVVLLIFQFIIWSIPPTAGATPPPEPKAEAVKLLVGDDGNDPSIIVSKVWHWIISLFDDDTSPVSDRSEPLIVWGDQVPPIDGRDYRVVLNR